MLIGEREDGVSTSLAEAIACQGHDLPTARAFVPIRFGGFYTEGLTVSQCDLGDDQELREIESGAVIVWGDNLRLRFK